MSGAPVMEGDRIVGLLSPRLAGPAAPGATLPFATVTKAALLKELLAAHEQAYGA